MAARNAYSIAFRNDKPMAAKLSTDGKGSTKVHWLAEDTLVEQHLSELAKGGKHCALVLSPDEANLVQTRLPALKGKELEAAINGIALRQKGAGEAGWARSFMLRKVDKPSDGPLGQLAYTLLLADQAKLDLLRDACDKQDVNPRVVVPSPIALEAMLRAEHIQKPEGEWQSWSLVYLGEEDMFLVIGDMAGPLLYRGLPADLSDGEDKEEYIKRLVMEIERSSFFAKQSDQSFTVESIHVCGDPNLVEPLVEELKNKASIPIAHWHPQDDFEYDGDAELWRMLPLLAGALIDSGVLPLNLYVKRDSEGTGNALKAYGIAAAGALLIFSAPLLLGGSLLTRGIQESVINRQSDQLEIARDDAREAAELYLIEKSLVSREERIALSGGGSIPLGDVIRDVASRLPDHVRLVDLTLSQIREGHYRLYLTGEAIGRSSEEAQAEYIRFRDSLSRSSLIAGDEDPSYMRLHPGSSQGVFESKVSFSIEYSIKTGAI